MNKANRMEQNQMQNGVELNKTWASECIGNQFESVDDYFDCLLSAASNLFLISGISFF